MTELISDRINLDLSEKIAIPINFAIADFKEPEKRKRNFSKTIELPDTSINRSYFKGAFSLTVTDDSINFDATAKREAVLKRHGVSIMPKALLQLISVTRLNGHLRFTVRLYSETIDLFLLLSNIGVNELDWSAYDHTLTQANIAASWAAASGSGYLYPLIERGTDRPNATTWRTVDMIPYVYLREVATKILDFAGISYSSTFLDSTRFKNVLFGYGGGEVKALTQADIDQREVEINTGDYNYQETKWPTDETAIGPGGTTFPILKTLFPKDILDDDNFTYVVAQDDLAQFDDSRIFIQRTGNYTLDLGMDLDFSFSIGTMTYNNAIGPFIRVLRNGSLIHTGSDFFEAQSGTVNLSFTRNFFFSAGDVIEIEINPGFLYTTLGAGIEKQTATLDITTNGTITIDLDCIDTQLNDGSTISLNQFLPNMKCSEALVGAIRQFNLMQSDPDVYGVTTVEPLIDFYSSTAQFDDITDLIDHSRDFIIKPTANEYAKTIKFKFKKNKDHDAAVYLEKYEEEYGDYTLVQGSHFAKGEKVIQVPWSTIVPYETDDGLILPRFIIYDANNNPKPNKGEARIMMRNGLKNGDWTLRNTSAPFNPTNYATYPSVHHFDDWENPTYDLNFQLVQEVFYITSEITTINTYSEYYSQFINEMISRAGKWISCYIKWLAQDVKNRDFGRLLMINGALFRLNKIKDFDDDAADSQNIELIKVLEARKPKRVIITLPGPTVPGNPNARGQQTGAVTTDVNYSIDGDYDEYIGVTVKAVTITLPNEVERLIGKRFIINNDSNGVITIDADPNTINGSITVNLAKNNTLEVFSNGTEWRII